MKVYKWELRVTVNDIECNDMIQVRKEIVAPDMSLEEAYKFMYLFAMNEWDKSSLQFRIDHIQKLYLLGFTD